jgi:hypothetical protein
MRVSCVLSRISISLLLMAAVLSTSAAAAAERSYWRYVLNGLDRGDGMSVAIDLDNGYLLITSDHFDANRCVDVPAALCFESGYMDFASPPPGGAETWAGGGETFTAAGTCRARLGSERITALRIVSEQHQGRFEFYYDATGNRLLGWRVDYTLIDGRPAHDVWMLKGVRRCRPVASED